MLTNEPIDQAETTTDIYQILNGSATSHTGEYFLVENRQKTGFDAALPSSGLLLWHIDEAQTSNANENYAGCSACTGHYKVQLIQADNKWEMEKNINRGEAGDPYPGVCATTTCNTSLTATTAPNSKLWNGQASGVTITSISASGSRMTATMSPTATSAPVLSISKTHAGSFTQGQQNALYTVRVSNGTGAGPTSGTLTVTDTIPSGLTLVSMSGTGWSCSSSTCTRNEALNGGSSYPDITVSVNVKVTATSPQVNAVSVSGGGSSGASTSDSTTINVAVVAPTNVVATATSTTSVGVSWQPSAGAATYQLYRSSNGTNWSAIGSPTVSLSASDGTVGANTAYLYMVRSRSASGTESGDSNRDVATTVIFSDANLVARSSTAKTTHVSQLRTAVNAVRALAGLPAASFTDATLSSNLQVKRIHVIELRTALDAARSVLSLPSITYSDSAVTIRVTTIKVAHIAELRSGVQ
jgi:uncharacterized repeat protein (TIGR01451 family)